MKTRIYHRTGGAMGDRTPDLLIANETLYQLSYDPNVMEPVTGLEPVTCGLRNRCSTAELHWRIPKNA